MVTATVKITQTRRTARPWPAGHPPIPVPTTPPSACLLTSCVMARMTAETAPMRANSVVRPRQDLGLVSSVERHLVQGRAVGNGLGQEEARLCLQH